MNNAFGFYTAAHPDPIEKGNCILLEETRSNARTHSVAAPALQDDILDSSTIEHVA
ncbi:hypothetical protein CHELA1G11_40090 [Hyphomicrobiales bacterium]|nr:hypothetical protein CHELA1G2_40050 [Hyphomicrobiales bacterium]CAH1696509.1 hypothetical protein CHELA1G11_40090 [Hyphomicrobiales bacterium]